MTKKWYEDQIEQLQNEIADLRGHLNEWGEKWKSQEQGYQQQLAAMSEQQAETHKLEIEQLMMKHKRTCQKGNNAQHTHGRGMQQQIKHGARKPIEHHLQVKGEPMVWEITKLSKTGRTWKDEGNSKKTRGRVLKVRYGTKEDIPGPVIS